MLHPQACHTLAHAIISVASGVSVETQFAARQAYNWLVLRAL